MGKTHSMKGNAPQQGGTANSRYIDQKSAVPSDSASGSPSVAGGGQGLGRGTINSRTSAVRPNNGAGDQIGPAQPLRNAPALDPSAQTSQLGSRVYKATKPRK